MFYWFFYKKKDEEILTFLKKIFEHKHQIYTDSLESTCIRFIIQFTDVKIVFWYTLHSTSFTIYSLPNYGVIYDNIDEYYTKSFGFVLNKIHKTDERQLEVDKIKEKYASM